MGGGTALQLGGHAVGGTDSPGGRPSQPRGEQASWRLGPCPEGGFRGIPPRSVAPPALLGSGLLGSHGGPPEILRLGASLQLDQEKQEQGLALLRQRAELEVWETQKALDQMLFKHRLEVSWPVPRARGLFRGRPHSLPRGSATPPAHPIPGPFQVDLALWLCGGRLPCGRSSWGGSRHNTTQTAGPTGAGKRMARLPARGRLSGLHTDAPFKAEAGHFGPLLARGHLAEGTDDGLSLLPACVPGVFSPESWALCWSL